MREGSWQEQSERWSGTGCGKFEKMHSQLVKMKVLLTKQRTEEGTKLHDGI